MTKWTNIAIARFRDYEDKLPNPSLDRMHSWSECYEFFRDNLSKLATPGLDLSSPLLEEATLRLAAYLASFGMYVRNARLLQCSKNVLKFPLLEISMKSAAIVAIGSRTIPPVTRKTLPRIPKLSSQLLKSFQRKLTMLSRKQVQAHKLPFPH